MISGSLCIIILIRFQGNVYSCIQTLATVLHPIAISHLVCVQLSVTAVTVVLCTFNRITSQLAENIFKIFIRSQRKEKSVI